MCITLLKKLKRTIVTGDDVNAKIQEQFMNIVTEHVAEKSLKGLDKDS